MTDSRLSEAATRSEARVGTAHAQRYLAQLCKHFGHKLPTTYDDVSGQITSPSAPAGYRPSDR